MMDEVSSIRARHLSAKPKQENPAWVNTHTDMGRLFTAYDILGSRIARAENLFKALTRAGLVTNPALEDEINLWLASKAPVTTGGE